MKAINKIKNNNVNNNNNNNNNNDNDHNNNNVQLGNVITGLRSAQSFDILTRRLSVIIVAPLTELLCNYPLGDLQLRTVKIY